MWLQFWSMLSWWQWALLAAVPAAILALYFLKLRRAPVEVPSTYLWFRMMEDLHVNALWQRLRSNLLLLLQLLVVFLVMLALLRPGHQSEKPVGDRFILLIDNSASMQSTDIEPSRLAEAKRQARELVEQMDGNDVAMVLSFADTAQVEQPFTDNRRRLRAAIDRIEPTARSTSLLEALRTASGLANPGRSATDITDYQVAEPLPATAIIYSDGRFPDPQSFILGNLTPVYRPVGTEAANVGITALSARSDPRSPGIHEVFAEVRNFSLEPRTVEMELYVDGELADAARLEIVAEKFRGASFRVPTAGEAGIELRLGSSDAYAVDDVAWTVVNPPRPARVLLFSPGNEPLITSLQTPAMQRRVELRTAAPEVLSSEEQFTALQPDTFDLVVFDRCQPPTMPEANTWFLGTLPPLEAWAALEERDVPQIIDVDPNHPLTRWLQLDDVLVVRAAPLELPSGGTTLIRADAGPLAAVAPRREFQDLVLAFPLLEHSGGQALPVTNWWLRPSFPVFIYNVVDYLGNAASAERNRPWKPGDVITLPVRGSASQVTVRTPEGQTHTLTRQGSEPLRFSRTDPPGIYEVTAGSARTRFAVNTFDEQESHIAVRNELSIGYEPVEGDAGRRTTRRELWKWLLACGLVVLAVEWYVYGRRVSL